MITFPLVQGGRPVSEISIELQDFGKRNLQIFVVAGPLNGEFFRDWDYFSALNKLRIELEKMDLLTGCIGSLRNFYPSNMALDMGQGKVGYLMKIGEKAGRKNIVKTFEIALDFSELASVNDQLLFYQKWLSSLKPSVDPVRGSGLDNE